MPNVAHVIVALALDSPGVPHEDQSVVMSRVADGEMLTLAWLRFEFIDGSSWYLHNPSNAFPSDLSHLNIVGWEGVVACSFFKDFISLRDPPGSTRRRWAYFVIVSLVNMVTYRMRRC